MLNRRRERREQWVGREVADVVVYAVAGTALETHRKDAEAGRSVAVLNCVR